ncbi:tyrosine-type recombinase/integrase [Pseudomonas sp. CAH-1]|uniref:site-specific integrase n=1 Tax=Pseudomonas sp. CAH-1 TaxID=2605744 RepID=UPI0012AE404F|nr:site-specific integrase [Pseudomonas sp. CAH-1]MRT63378.1 tyrosine-type recombinase/integrase [Pseudomonas sp. CAH-1]
MTPQNLFQEYLADHDLRQASAKTYGAAIKSLEKNFGISVEVESIDRRAILAWRNKVIEGGLSKRSWNTYSNHLRTMWGYGVEYGILPDSLANPFKKTTLIPPKRPSKIIEGDAIKSARLWLTSLVAEEEATGGRARITPAWFWLATFEIFYYTGIRLNALLCIRLRDIDWTRKLIYVNAETEKTHRGFCIPIMKGLEPHIERIVTAAIKMGFKDEDQLFNVNRFSIHYRSKTMNIHQIEDMFKKLTHAFGIRMTPHRFRHTLATDLMRQPERNIHLTKALLNHSNIATTMSYIEVDYEHMRAVLDERSLHQGAIRLERREDPARPELPQPKALPQEEARAQRTLADIETTPRETTPTGIRSLLELESPTAYELLAALPKQKRPKKYPLEQISAPTTGLSHELGWDGPGTLWADLGIPPCSLSEDAFDPAALMDIAPSVNAVGSYRWS